MTAEQIQATYLKLSVELHPDKSNYDSQDDFVAMKQEYEDIKAIKKHWLALNQYFEQMYYTPPQQRPEMDLQDIFSKGLSFINDASKVAKEVNKVAKNVNKAFKQVG